MPPLRPPWNKNVNEAKDIVWQQEVYIVYLRSFEEAFLHRPPMIEDLVFLAKSSKHSFEVLGTPNESLSENIGEERDGLEAGAGPEGLRPLSFFSRTHPEVYFVFRFNDGVSMLRFALFLFQTPALLVVRPALRPAWRLCEGRAVECGAGNGCPACPQPFPTS